MNQVDVLMMLLGQAEPDGGPSPLGYASLLDWFLRGGPVMYPILLLSVVGVFFWLRGLLNVRWVRKDLPRGDTLLRLARERNLTSLRDAARAGTSITDRIAERLLPLAEDQPSELRREATEVMSNALHGALDAHRWVRTCARLAPLLGLLGTVVGISITFSQVAHSGGADDYARLADGINQALYTTIFGLTVALVLTVLGGLLTNRVISLERAGYRYTDTLILFLKEARPHHER